MNIKIKRILIIILIVVMLITIVNIVFINRKSTIGESDNFIPLEPETIIPQNSYLFFGKYVNGEVTSKEFYETISDYYKVTFPNYYNSLKNNNESQLKEYYNSNKEQIKSDIMVQNEEEFLKFCTIVSKLKENELILQSIEIKEGSIIERTDYTIAELDVKYLDCTNISMMIKVYKKVQENKKNIEFSMVNK